MATAAAPPQFTELDTLYEVVGAQVVEMPPMGAYEAEIASLLQVVLGTFAFEHRLGRAVTEMLFDLRPAVDRGRRPDVAFVSAARWPLGQRVPRTPAWAVVPELAVEMVSPTDTMAGMMTKLEEYFRAGARRVWVVVLPDQFKVYDHDAPTSVRILTPADALDGGDLLPGFRLPLATVFGPDGGAA